jgi:hypothetical protein
MGCSKSTKEKPARPATAEQLEIMRAAEFKSLERTRTQLLLQSKRPREMGRIIENLPTEIMHMIFLQCDLATLAKLQPASRVRRYVIEHFKPWRKVVSVPRNRSILEAIVREVKGKPIANLILKQPFMATIDELKNGKTEWCGYYTEFYSTVAREAAS